MKRFITWLSLAVMVFAAAFCTPVLAAETVSPRDHAITLKFSNNANVGQITSLQFQMQVENVSETAVVSVEFAESLGEEQQVIARSTYHDGVLTVYIAGARTLLQNDEQQLPVGNVVTDDPSSASAMTLRLMPASLEFLNGMDGTVDIPANSVKLVSELTTDGETSKGEDDSQGGASSNTVKKNVLESLLQACGKLKKADYTAESWNVFAGALKGAKAVFADETATQEAVDAAVEELLAAYDGLCHAADDTETTNETTKAGIQKALDHLLKELDGLVSSDYTDDSWNDLYVLMEQARELLKSEDASKEELKAILDQLRKAQRDLARVDGADETGAPLEKGTGKDTDAPQTGDTRNPILWIILGAAGGACAIAAIVILVIRKKKS